MATVEENITAWSAWTDNGDKWSKRWGSPQSEWWRTIMPRIYSFLPASTIVEIGCGHGRWTQFLQQHCFHLHAVDVAQACVDACEERFRSLNISFSVTDGRSLPDVEADFIFSFDSLVHADAPEIRGYLADFVENLTPDGVAFIHHSNMAAYPNRDHAWRSHSVSGLFVQEWCKQADLCCLVTELVSWDSGDMLSDAFSLIVRPDSRWARNRDIVQVVVNNNFPGEMDWAMKLARSYDWNV